MLHLLAKKLTSIVFKNCTFTKYEFDVYVYGFELLISSLTGLTVVLVTGHLINQFLESLVFILVFTMLRSFTGGYHAKTYTKCLIVTVITYFTVIILSSILELKISHKVIIILCGLGILIIFAPIKNINKCTNKTQKYKNKIFAIIAFFIFSIVGILSDSINTHISNIIFYSIMADIALLFAKEKEGGVNEFLE